MKVETTFVRLNTDDHPGEKKMSKKAPRFVVFNFLKDHQRQQRISQKKKRRTIVFGINLIHFFDGKNRQ